MKVKVKLRKYKLITENDIGKKVVCIKDSPIGGSREELSEGVVPVGTIGILKQFVPETHPASEPWGAWVEVGDNLCRPAKYWRILE